MNKGEIVEKLISTDTIPQQISVAMCDTLIVIYWLGKLEEGGFIKSNHAKVTTSGFDSAMSLIEEGWKVDTKEIIPSIIKVLNFKYEDRDEAEMLTYMILEIQEKGIDGMKDVLEDSGLDPINPSWELMAEAYQEYTKDRDFQEFIDYCKDNGFRLTAINKD